MATGLQSTTNDRYYEILLLSASEVTAIPTEQAAASALKSTPTSAQFFDLRTLDKGAGVFEDCEVLVENVAGTGAVSATVRLWTYHASTGLAYPWGVGTDAAKGIINNGAACGATDTDKLRHRETIPGPGLADGIQAQITASAGTGTETFNVRILIPRAARY